MKRLLGELAFAAGLAITLGLVLHLGWRPIAQALSVVGFGGVLILALAHAPTLFTLGWAWWTVARDGPGPGPLTFVWGRLMRDSGGELLPFSQVGGFALGARAVALGGSPWMRAAASSLLDVFAEQAAKTPYTIAGVALLMWLAPDSGLVPPALVILGATTGVVGLLILRRVWVRARLESLAETLVRRWPGSRAPDPGAAAAAMRAALAPGGRIGVSVTLHVIGWCLGAFEAWLAFRLIGERLDFAQAMVVDALFTAVRVFVFTVPAAAGVQEAAYIVLAGLFHVPAPTAVAFSLVRRARDFVIGAPALIVWQLLERARRRAKRSGLRPDAGG